MKVYVASSWRNPFQPSVVRWLLDAGYDVYDFRAPDEPGGTAGGFQWSEIDPAWERWTPDQYRKAMGHELATVGLSRDLQGLISCDACVLVMPCGRSAHLELGYMLGAGKPGLVYIPTDLECESALQRWFHPELMWGVADNIVLTQAELFERLGWVEGAQE